MSTKSLTFGRRGMEVPRRVLHLVEVAKTEAERRGLANAVRSGYHKTLTVLAASALAGLAILDVMAREMQARKQREPAAAAKRKPTQAEIAGRAYEIYLARGGRPGSELDDWLQAEAELRTRRQSA